MSTARRRELGAELRRLREQLGLKGQDMAQRLEWTPCQLSRVETGKRTADTFDIIRYAVMCGLNKAELGELFDLAVEPDDYRIKHHNGKVSDKLRTLIFQESTANSIEIYEPLYIPGLLQTEDYIRALFEETGEVDPADIEDLVEVRLSRREVLTRVNPAQCAFYVHEVALRMPVGGPWVMHEQMLHCSLPVAGRNAPSRWFPHPPVLVALAMGRFISSAIQKVPRLSTSSTRPQASSWRDPKELRAYRAVLNRVASVALTMRNRGSLISSMASEYEQQGAAQRWQRPRSGARVATAEAAAKVAASRSRSGAGAVGVRDSKNADGPRLAFSATTWRTFVAGKEPHHECPIVA